MFRAHFFVNIFCENLSLLDLVYVNEIFCRAGAHYVLHYYGNVGTMGGGGVRPRVGRHCSAMHRN